MLGDLGSSRLRVGRAPGEGDDGNKLFYEIKMNGGMSSAYTSLGGGLSGDHRPEEG